MEPVCVKDEVLDEETQLVLIKEEDMGDEEEDGDAHPVLVKRERGEEEEESARNLSSPSPPPPPPLLQWQCLERPDPFSKDVTGRHREDRLAPDGSLAGVDSLFPCRQCQRSFSSSWELTGHQCGGSDAEKVRFECPVCGDRFERPTAFIMHKRSHVGQSRYVCTECGRTWKTLKRLLAHRRSHAGDRPHQCEECGRGFKRARALQRHRKGHHGTRERAEEEEEEEEEGGEGCGVREGVGSPAASPHSSLDQSLQCLQCFMTFRDVETTQRHLRFKHPLEFERRLQGRTVFACSVCEQTRPSSLQLSEHQRTHRKWSLLPPAEVGGSEGEEQQRERSERRQEEEGGLGTLRASTADGASLQCLHCRITFSDLRMKERHMRSQHPPGSAQILPRPPKGQPRPFCCTVCGERFIHEATLREHGRNNHQGAGHTQWEELCT